MIAICAFDVRPTRSKKPVKLLDGDPPVHLAGRANQVGHHAASVPLARAAIGARSCADECVRLAAKRRRSGSRRDPVGGEHTQAWPKDKVESPSRTEWRVVPFSDPNEEKS